MNDSTTDIPAVYWGTNYAGKIVGITIANGDAENPLSINSQLGINGTTNLSKIIVGNSEAYVQTLQYVQRQGVRQGQIQVYGAGPKGTGSGYLYLWFLTEGGFVHSLSLFSSSPGWHYDDFEDMTPIIGIWWGPNPME